MNFCTARVAPEKADFRPALPLRFKPEFTGEHMNTFKDQYLHPSWQKKRLEVMELAGFECNSCGDKEKTLHVHHRRYVRGRKVWEYSADELMCLCEDCHERTHTHRKLLDQILQEAEDSGSGAFEIAIGLLAGYFAADLSLRPETERAAIEVDGHSYDLGMLAAIAAGSTWKKLAAAADAVKPTTMNPAQEGVYARWAHED